MNGSLLSQSDCPTTWHAPKMLVATFGAELIVLTLFGACVSICTMVLFVYVSRLKKLADALFELNPKCALLTTFTDGQEGTPYGSNQLQKTVDDVNWLAKYHAGLSLTHYFVLVTVLLLTLCAMTVNSQRQYVTECPKGNWIAEQKLIDTTEIVHNVDIELPTCEHSQLDYDPVKFPLLPALANMVTQETLAARSEAVKLYLESCKEDIPFSMTVALPSIEYMEAGWFGSMSPKYTTARNCTASYLFGMFFRIQRLAFEMMQDMIYCDAERERFFFHVMTTYWDVPANITRYNNNQYIPKAGFTWDEMYRIRFGYGYSNVNANTQCADGTPAGTDQRNKWICPLNGSALTTPTGANRDWAKCHTAKRMVGDELEEAASYFHAHRFRATRNTDLAMTVMKYMRDNDMIAAFKKLEYQTNLRIYPSGWDVNTLRRVIVRNITLFKPPSMRNSPTFFCNTNRQSSYGFKMNADLIFDLRDTGYIIRPIVNGNTSISGVDENHYMVVQTLPTCQANDTAIDAINGTVLHRTHSTFRSVRAAALHERGIFKRPVDTFMTPDEIEDAESMGQFTSTELSALKDLLSLRSNNTASAEALKTWGFMGNMLVQNVYRNPFSAHDFETASKLIQDYIPDLATYDETQHTGITCHSTDGRTYVHMNISAIHTNQNFVATHCLNGAAEIMDTSKEPHVLIGSIDKNGVHFNGAPNGLVQSAMNTFHEFNLAGREHATNFDKWSSSWKAATGLDLAKEEAFKRCTTGVSHDNCSWADTKALDAIGKVTHRSYISQLQEQFKTRQNVDHVFAGMTASQIGAARTFLRHGQELNDTFQISHTIAAAYGKHGAQLAAVFKPTLMAAKRHQNMDGPEEFAKKFAKRACESGWCNTCGAQRNILSGSYWSKIGNCVSQATANWVAKPKIPKPGISFRPSLCLFSTCKDNTAGGDLHSADTFKGTGPGIANGNDVSGSGFEFIGSIIGIIALVISGFALLLVVFLNRQRFAALLGCMSTAPAMYGASMSLLEKADAYNVTVTTATTAKPTDESFAEAMSSSIAIIVYCSCAALALLVVLVSSLVLCFKRGKCQRITQIFCFICHKYQLRHWNRLQPAVSNLPHTAINMSHVKSPMCVSGVDQIITQDDMKACSACGCDTCAVKICKCVSYTASGAPVVTSPEGERKITVTVRTRQSANSDLEATFDIGVIKRKCLTSCVIAFAALCDADRMFSMRQLAGSTILQKLFGSIKVPTNVASDMAFLVGLQFKEVSTGLVLESWPTDVSSDKPNGTLTSDTTDETFASVYSSKKKDAKLLY